MKEPEMEESEKVVTEFLKQDIRAHVSSIPLHFGMTYMECENKIINELESKLERFKSAGFLENYTLETGENLMDIKINLTLSKNNE